MLNVPAAIATPAPSPSPASPLKIIATVRASARCTLIISHANNAIVSDLSDDRTLTQTITQLRIVNLDDGNILHRQNGLAQLHDLARTLSEESTSGQKEIRQLRKLAEASTDPDERLQLKGFADALGGAIGRQEKMARDLNGYLASIDALDMERSYDAPNDSNEFGINLPPITAVPSVSNAYPLTATQSAQIEATDFESRLPLVQKDEAHAAAQIDDALSRC